MTTSSQTTPSVHDTQRPTLGDAPLTALLEAILHELKEIHFILEFPDAKDRYLRRKLPEQY